MDAAHVFEKAKNAKLLVVVTTAKTLPAVANIHIHRIRRLLALLTHPTLTPVHRSLHPPPRSATLRTLVVRTFVIQVICAANIVGRLIRTHQQVRNSIHKCQFKLIHSISRFAISSNTFSESINF